MLNTMFWKYQNPKTNPSFKVLLLMIEEEEEESEGGVWGCSSGVESEFESEGVAWRGRESNFEVGFGKDGILRLVGLNSWWVCEDLDGLSLREDEER